LILAAAGARVLYNRHRPADRVREDYPAGRVREEYQDGRAREDYQDGRASEDYPAGRASEAGESGGTQPLDPPSALERGPMDAPINSPPAAHRR
jgi:hypothetical protein